MSLDADVLIVGAGLTGAGIAAELALRNVRVALVDALRAGHGATRLAPGLVLDDPQISATATGAHRLVERANQLGVNAEPRQVADADVPAADPTRLHVAHLRPGWQLDFATLIERMLQAPGIQLLEQAEIQRIESDESRVMLVAEGRTLAASHVVLATGAYAGLLVPGLPGTHHVVRCASWVSHPQSEPVQLNGLEQGLPMVLRAGRMAAMQDASGRVRITAMQTAGDATSDPVEDVHRFVRRYMHTLYEQTEHWHTGVAVQSVSGQPLVGPLAREQRIVLALGAGPFAPAWVPLIADRVAAHIFA